MFWWSLSTLGGSFRNGLMIEFDKNPSMMRQAGAAVAVVIAAGAGMGLIAHRGAEQRDAALWAERAAAFRTYELAESSPAARLELVSFSSTSGLKGRASGMLAADALDRQAMTVSASLRGALGVTPPSVITPKVESGAGATRAASARAREQRCLAEAIYYEARGESYQGQMAVAEVVTNRVTSRHWPNTYCGVVYEGSTRASGCQFSFTCDGSLNRRPKGPAWRQSNTIAAQVMIGLVRPITHRATHYHTTAIRPYWISGLIETGRIGSHVFYRLPTAAEKAALNAANKRRAAKDSAAASEVIEAPVVDEAALGEGEGAAPAGADQAPIIAPETSPAPAPAPAEDDGDVAALSRELAQEIPRGA